ncbi:MAG: DUF416 family protein, partial [Isosphaeraceae bacterium]
MTLQFDLPTLLISLENLPTRARSAFAAACAERQSPSFVSFSEKWGREKPGMLENALNDLWKTLEGEDTGADLEQHLDRCDSFVSDEENV